MKRCSYFLQTGNGCWESVCDHPIRETKAKNQLSKRQVTDSRARSGSNVNVINTIWPKQYRSSLCHSSAMIQYQDALTSSGGS